MKRRAFKLLLFLLAGAIINVAVAWWCASSTDALPDDEWVEAIDLLSGLEHTYAVHASVVGACRTSSMRLLEIRGRCDLAPCVVQYVISGWPAFTLSGAKVATLAPGTANTFQSALTFSAFGIGDWDSRLYANTAQILPTKPIWPGFAINAIFYAAIVWMLFAVPGAVRRRLRHKRGQCASCGYSLRGTPDTEKCPECGATA